MQAMWLWRAIVATLLLLGGAVLACSRNRNSDTTPRELPLGESTVHASAPVGVVDDDAGPRDGGIAPDAPMVAK